MKAILLCQLTLLLAIAYGWINNVVIIAHSDFSQITGMLVIRCIGVFLAPLGAVLGYL